MKKSFSVFLCFVLLLSFVLSPLARVSAEAITNPSISSNLSKSSTDANSKGQVSKLQNFLKNLGFLDSDAATGYFGALTLDAVKKFQDTFNLKTSGYVGELTRGKIAEIVNNQVASVGGAVLGASTSNTKSVSKNPIGYLDNVSCDVIQGWTCDASDFTKPLEVDLYKSDGSSNTQTFVISGTANTSREDAVGKNCGGNTAHGFSIATPESLKDGKSRSIFAYGINIGVGENKDVNSNNTPLKGSTALRTNTLKCAPTTVTPPVVPAKPAKIEVLYPNGGEDLTVGDTLDIRWRTTNPDNTSSNNYKVNFSVTYKSKNGQLMTQTAEQSVPNTGYYRLTIPDYVNALVKDATPDSFRLNASLVNATGSQSVSSDQSDVNFDIAPTDGTAKVRVTSANIKLGFGQNRKESTLESTHVVTVTAQGGKVIVPKNAFYVDNYKQGEDNAVPTLRSDTTSVRLLSGATLNDNDNYVIEKNQTAVFSVVKSSLASELLQGVYREAITGVAIGENENRSVISMDPRVYTKFVPVVGEGKDGGSNPTQSIRVLSPNGGESFKSGDQVNIRWESKNVSKFYINYANVDQHSIDPIIENIEGNSYTWTVPTSIIPGKYSISILNGTADGTATLSDSSDSYFTISNPTQTTNGANGYFFTQNLTVGSSGDDVKALQNILLSSGYLDLGDNQSVTGYFGSATKSALSTLQAAVGITPVDGYFGAVTRRYLNETVLRKI